MSANAQSIQRRTCSDMSRGSNALSLRELPPGEGRGEGLVVDDRTRSLGDKDKAMSCPILGPPAGASPASGSFRT